MFHTDFLRLGGTGYPPSRRAKAPLRRDGGQPVLVGNLPTRLGRAPGRNEEM